MVEVRRLIAEDMLVEIEADAIVSEEFRRDDSPNAALK